MASLAPVSSNPLAYGGVDPVVNPIVVVSQRPPTTLDIGYNFGTLWDDKANFNGYMLMGFLAGAAIWEPIGGGTVSLSTLTGNTGGAVIPTAKNINVIGAGALSFSGSGSTLTGTITPGTALIATLTGNTGGALSPTAGNFNILGSGAIAFAGSGSTLTASITPGTALIATLTGDTGGALSPTAGNFNILGTTNQITISGAGSTLTHSLSATLVAPGSVTATTTLTATLGAITATNGNFVGSTAGTGFLFNSPTATVAATDPAVVNGRTGQAIFTAVSIAAAADLTLTITNSAITGATTQVIYSMSGSTTGSAPSIKSVTNSAGSSAIVVTNGTGATTTTADIVLNFVVVN